MVRLFLRDQFPLILINFIQLLLVLFVVWMSGFQQFSLLIYALFLGIFLLTIYLVFRYITHRRFYHRLTRQISSLDEVFESLDTAPVSAALSDLLKAQHRLYVNDMQQQEKKRKDHLTFINQWVHQMKTPLSVVELIIQDRDDEQMMSIQEETDKLEKGLEMVLYVARLDAFEQDFHVQPVSLKAAVDEAIQDNKRLFIKNQVYPDVQVSPAMVESDEKWLEFIFNQVITNGIKYSSGIGKKVSIYDQKTENGIDLVIQDMGVGIPMTDLKRVFDPFFTGENGRVYRESTGMGLYLVKEVCEKLGHEVHIESAQGEGTLVKVSFIS
ncbi:sensor histidine kinase [Oceanobacillus profundus]|uniref:sensor histidine kinase n=1 Tax=Oceanobacillus profundus TaxID=372463 RepID=UPI0036267641